MRRNILILVIAIVVIGGGYLAYRQFAAAPVEPETETPIDVNTVAVNTGLGTVSAEGQIVPLRHTQLSVLTAGPVVEIVVAEGDSVQAGDPILRLDSSDQETALQQAIAGAIQADAGLQTAQAGLQAAEAGLQAAEVGVKAAQAAMAVVTAPPTAEQVAVSEASVAVAQASINAALGNQSLTAEGASDAQILSAEAQVVAAQAAAKPVQDIYGILQRFEADEETIADVAVQLNAANANLQAAQAALVEAEAGATQAERVAAGNAVAAAQAQRDAAQSQLDLLLAGAQAEQVNISQIGVAQAEAARAEAELGVEQARAAVAQAEAGKVQAETAVSAAQEAVAQRTLTAPFAGTIASLNIEVGEIASPGVPIVSLADFSKWVVETTDLTELDVVAVAVGFPVEVRVDALPDAVLPGTVSDIDTVATLSRGDVTYTVTVELDNNDSLPLRWGMTAFVDVDVEQ